MLLRTFIIDSSKGFGRQYWPIDDKRTVPKHRSKFVKPILKMRSRVIALLTPAPHLSHVVASFRAYPSGHVALAGMTRCPLGKISLKQGLHASLHALELDLNSLFQSGRCFAINTCLGRRGEEIFYLYDNKDISRQRMRQL